eukprot:4905217-Amphidinium_carterae.2
MHVQPMDTIELRHTVVDWLWIQVVTSANAPRMRSKTSLLHLCAICPHVLPRHLSVTPMAFGSFVEGAFVDNAI